MEGLGLVGGVLAEALEGLPRITDALRLLVHEALVELLLVHYTVLRGHEEYVRELEAGRDALLDSLEAQAPEALDSLTSEERHQWYKLLKLGADVFADGRVEISWAGAESGEAVRETATLSPPKAR